jgi:hypothetical protein
VRVDLFGIQNSENMVWIVFFVVCGLAAVAAAIPQITGKVWPHEKTVIRVARPFLALFAAVICGFTVRDIAYDPRLANLSATVGHVHMAIVAIAVGVAMLIGAITISKNVDGEWSGWTASCLLFMSVGILMAGIMSMYGFVPLEEPATTTTPTTSVEYEV